MSIVRKLWLGFGVLILIFVLACLIIFIRERAVNNTLDEVVEVEEPTRVAAFEMEINVAEMARDVLDYLDTGDPRYREQFEDNRADFERFKDRYDALTDTERGERQGERIEVLYEEYAKLGEALTGAEPPVAQDGAISSEEQRFLELQAELDAVFDEEVQPWHGRQLREAEAAAEDAINGVYATLVALLIAGLLVGSLAAYLINRGIIGSIGRLREGADRVGRGDLAHRIEPDTADELGTVAVAFNAMLDRRREVEAALKESEEKFRGLSDASFEGIAIVEDGRVVETNTAFVRMYGYEPSEIVGMSAMDFIAPESREVALRHISSGSEEPYEAVGIRKDGTAFDVEARGKMSSYQDRSVRVTAIRDITARKEAQEQLLKAEQRYRELVERMPAVVYVQEIGSPDAVAYISPRIEALTGYSPEECRDPDLRWRMVHPEDRERMRSEDEQTVEPGAVSSDEYRVLHHDGRTVWVRNESVVVEDEASGSLYWQGFMVDITERKNAEQRLQEAEARYRTLVEQIPAIIYVQQSAEPSATTYISPQAEAMLGYPQEKFTSDPEWWVGLIHPDDRERVLAEDERTNETGETFKAEYRMIASDGRVLWFSDEATLVRDDDGRPLYWQGVQVDITERRQAEEEQRRSEARVRAIVETTPDAVITMTKDGLVRSFNPAAERIFGYAADEVVGKPLRMLMPERFRELHESGFRRYLDSGEPHVVGMGAVELAGLRKDGTEFPLDLSLGEMREEDDILFTGIVRDITERKAAEEAVRENEKRFRQLFDQSVDALFVHDASGRIVDCNVEASRSLGYDREELLSLRIQDLATELASDRRERPTTEPTLWQRALSGEPGKVAGIHMGEHRRKDGTSFPVEVYVGSVEYGGERMIFASARDITERAQAEEALRRSEERYRLVAQATNEVIWDNDLTTNGQVWDGATEAMFGYAPEEMGDTAEWWEDRIHPEDRERVLANTEAVLADGGEAWTDEYRFRRADGAYVTLVDRAYVVRDEEGRPVRMLGSIMDVTKRRRAEEEIRELNESLERRVEERTAELRESEERYSLVVEGSNDSIFDWDMVEDTLFWNDRLFEMLGLSRSTFTPTLDAFFELVHPEDTEKVSENLTAHLERGEEFDVELRLRHTSGEYRTCIARGKAQRDEDGRPFRMAGTATDITERKRAEEALRLLARASAELSTSLDYQSTLGNVASLAVPQLADWCAVDVLNEDGSLDRLAVAHQDPEKVELAREVEKRYPADPEAPSGLYNVLRTGRPEFYPEIPEELLEASARDEEHLRLIRELGFSSAIIVPITARARTLGTITLVSAESGRKYGEADLRLAEDLARRSASAVDNARLFEAAQKELAERKRAEEEIRRLNESLENRVEERTAQLQNAIYELERAGENLRRAKEEAESASRAKSEFLANMSHEIRTPMNGVIGMTELLLDSPLSDEQREYAGTIRLSGESLLSIINDILDFSKIEAGEMRLETLDFDLRMAVEDVVALFAERAHEKGLELASLVDYDVPTALQGDPGRVRQILTNLVGNAIKFTERGEVVLRADLAEEDPERATVRISVKDTGIGMTEEQQTRVFQSFSQADASTTRRYGGTGLGLTISRQMVELMGGEIGVESEPGVGSTFFFTLPLKKQPGEARRAPGPLADLRNMRVLIVDDNATNRQILHKQLSSWGMESREVGDGPTALQELRSAALEDTPYDLAILDMQMPEMDGMQLARHISGDPAVSSTRLVLLTSIGQRGDGDEALQAGIEAYLTKPVRQSELYDAIATVMGTPESASDERSTLITRHTLREMQTGDRAHLLLAEDNPVNQKVATKMLERLGYRVDVARNGLEALEALSRNRYGAILMDVQMPEMDGYEATAEILRRRQEAPGTGGYAAPIIAMTANAMHGDREKALAAGMDDYLAKPVRQEELEETLGRWVSREAAEGAPNGAPSGAARSEANGEDRPLDPKVLASLRELGDAELLSELATMFLDDASSRLTDLRGAAEDGDAQTVEQAAHTLKGSSGNMGATRLAALCAELENAGASGDLSRFPELLENLETEFGLVRRALEAELEGDS